MDNQKRIWFQRVISDWDGRWCRNEQVASELDSQIHNWLENRRAPADQTAHQRIYGFVLHSFNKALHKILNLIAIIWMCGSDMVQQSMNGRFGLVRTQECLLGNFITDLMKEVHFNKLNMFNFILLIQIAQRLSTRIVQFWTRAQYEAIA